MRSHQALPGAEMRLVRRHLEALRPRLEALGLEVTASQVRRPLLTQVLGALEEGFVPTKDLQKRVAGASAKEVKAAIETLIDDGRAREVIRANGQGLMLAERPGGALMEHAELVELLRHLGNAQRLAKRAISKRGGRSRPAVLRDDVIGPLLGFGRASSEATRENGKDSLPEAIRARVDTSDRPLRIPELLRSLRVDRETGKRALLEGASAGFFGLEPESGMARLAPADAEWCPAGPQGTRLSWVVPRQHRGTSAR
jgi:hypothetical protein